MSAQVRGSSARETTTTRTRSRRAEMSQRRELGKGQGKGKGKGKSGSGAGWVDGEYYGCLSMSSEEESAMEGGQQAPACDYVVHVSSTSTDDSVEVDDIVTVSNATNSDGNVVVSSMEDADPYLAFDITQCDTYEHLWAWDIKMTCNSTGSYDCNCTFAGQLMEMGLLSCDDAVDCPYGCSICNNCMRVLGCQNVPGESIFASVGNSTTLATIFTLLLGVGFCFAVDKRRRKGKKGILNAHLIDEAEVPEGKIWMVPVDGAGVPAENGSDQKQVWLAPADQSSVSDQSERSSEYYELASTGGSSSFVDPKFPDILAGYSPAAGNQVLPKGGVKTIPTDVTSDSSGDHQEQRKSRRSNAVNSGKMTSHPRQEEEISSKDPIDGASSYPSDCTSASASSHPSDCSSFMSESTLTNSFDCEEGSL